MSELLERLSDRHYNPFQEKREQRRPFIDKDSSFYEEYEPNFVDLLAAAGRTDFLGGNMEVYRNLAEAQRLGANAEREDLWTDEMFEKYPALATQRGQALLSVANTEREAYWINQKITQEETDRALLDKDGLMARIAMGVISPENFIPMGIFFKGAKTVSAFAKAGAKTGLAGVAIGETGLQAMQETRPFEETAFALMGAPILGSLLGGGAGVVSVAANKAYFANVNSLLKNWYHDAVGIPRTENIPVRINDIISQVASDARKLYQSEANSTLREGVSNARTAADSAQAKLRTTAANAKKAYEEGLAEVRGKYEAGAKAEEEPLLTPSAERAVEEARDKAVARETEAQAATREEVEPPSEEALQATRRKQLDTEAKVVDDIDAANEELHTAHDAEETARREHIHKLMVARQRADDHVKDRTTEYNQADAEAHAEAIGKGEETAEAYEPVIAAARALSDEANAEAKTASEAVGRAELDLDRSTLNQIVQERANVRTNIDSLERHTLPRFQAETRDLGERLFHREPGEPHTEWLREEYRHAKAREERIREKIDTYKEEERVLNKEREALLSREREEAQDARSRNAIRFALLKFKRLLSQEKKWDEIEDTLAYVFHRNPDRYQSLLALYRSSYPERPKGLRRPISSWKQIPGQLIDSDQTLSHTYRAKLKIEAKMKTMLQELSRREAIDVQRTRGKEVYNKDLKRWVTTGDPGQKPMFPKWRTERRGKKYESLRRQVEEMEAGMVARARQVILNDALELPLEVPTIPARAASSVLPNWKDRDAWRGIVVHVNGKRGFIVEPVSTVKGYMSVYLLRDTSQVPKDIPGVSKGSEETLGMSYVLTSQVDVVLQRGVPQKMDHAALSDLPVVRTVRRAGRRGVEPGDFLGGMWTPSMLQIEELNKLAKAATDDASRLAYRERVNEMLSEHDELQVGDEGLVASEARLGVTEPAIITRKADKPLDAPDTEIGLGLTYKDVRNVDPTTVGRRGPQTEKIQHPTTDQLTKEGTPLVAVTRAFNRAHAARVAAFNIGQKLEKATREEVTRILPLGKGGKLVPAGDINAFYAKLKEDGREQILPLVEAYADARVQLREASAEAESIATIVPATSTEAAELTHLQRQGRERKMEEVSRETEKSPAETDTWQEDKRLREKWAEDLRQFLTLARSMAATHIDDPVERMRVIRENIKHYPSMAELFEEQVPYGPSVTRVPGKSPVETPALEPSVAYIDREIARAERALQDVETRLEYASDPEDILTGVGVTTQRGRALESFTRHLVIAMAKDGVLDPMKAAAHLSAGDLSRWEQMTLTRRQGTQVEGPDGEMVRIPEELETSELPTEGRLAAIQRGEVEAEALPAEHTKYTTEEIEIDDPNNPGQRITVTKKAYEPVPESTEAAPSISRDRVVDLLMTPDHELPDNLLLVKAKLEADAHGRIERLEDDNMEGSIFDRDDGSGPSGIPEAFHDGMNIDEATQGIQSVWGTSVPYANRYASGSKGAAGDGLGVRTTGSAPDHANFERPPQGLGVIDFLKSPMFVEAVGAVNKPLKGLVDADGHPILKKNMLDAIAALPEEIKAQLHTFADLKTHVPGIGDKTVEKLEVFEAGKLGYASHVPGEPHATPRTPEDIVSSREGSDLDDDIYGGVKPGDRPPLKGTHARTPPRKPPTGRGRQPYDVLGPGGAYGHHMQSILGLDEQQLQRVLRHNPKLRLLLSEFDETRSIAQMLVDYGPIWMKEYAEGKPKMDSAEGSIAVNWKSREIRVLKALPTLYVNAVRRINGKQPLDDPSITASRTTAISEAYKQKTTNNPSLTPRQFYKRVTRALRNGDKDAVGPDEIELEEVTKAAQLIRKEVFEPARKQLVAVRLLPREMAEVYDNSYVTRVWNIQKLADNHDDWVAKTKGLLVKDGHTDTDAYEIAESMYEGIMAGPEGRLDPLVFSTRKTRVGEARKVPGDDREWAEDGWLEEDIDVILKYWFRTTPGDIELAKLDMMLAPQSAKKSKHWRPDPSLRRLLNSTFDQIQGRVDALPPGSIERRKLMRQMESDRRDLEGMVDLLRNTYAIPKDPHGLVRRGAMLMRRHNYLTDGGTFMISSIPDMVRPIMVMGMSRVYGTGIRTLIKDWDTVKLNAREAELAGTAADWWTNQRTIDLYDLGGGYGTNRFERMVATASNEMSIVNGLAAWNTHLKQWSGVMISQRIIDYCEMVATGNKWDGSRATAEEVKEAVSELARGGISSEARSTSQYGSDASRIWGQVKDKPVESRLRILETESWNDSVARQKFRSALRSGVDSTINTPGVGDRPLFASRDLGRFILQYKAFAFASTMQTLIPGLQQPNRAFLSGAVMATGFGMMSIYIKAKAGGWNVPDMDSRNGLLWWVRNGISRAGFTGFLDDINTWMGFATNGQATMGNILTGTVDPEFLYTNRNLVSETFGPSISTLTDMAKVGSAATGLMMFGKQPRKAEWNAARRQLWWTNHVLLNSTVFQPAFTGMERKFRRKTSMYLDRGSMGVPNLQEMVPFR